VKTVQESNFVRKDFYIDPPEKGAATEVWAEWMKQEELRARVEKARHTRSFKHCETPDEFQPKVFSKQGGVYRQSALVGLTGTAENFSFDVGVEAGQEKAVVFSNMDANRNKRGSKGSGKKAKRNKRAARFLRMVKGGKN
jgi:hypothetical protein